MNQLKVTIIKKKLYMMFLWTTHLFSPSSEVHTVIKFSFTNVMILILG